MSRIRVCVVTGSRSDYGLLRWPMEEFKKSLRFDLKVVATGSHFSSTYGSTIREVERDGFKIASRVKSLFDTQSDVSLTKALGEWTKGFGREFHRLKPDLVIVMGDRYELLSVCAASVVMGIPIGHISGGEITEGAIDEQIRHAVTKMAHLHFVANKTYQANVMQMGEEPWRVCVSGEPGLDNLRRLRLLSRSELERDLKIDLSKRTAIVTFHSETLEPKNLESHMQELLSALEKTDLQIVMTFPNADLGSGRIIAQLRTFEKKYPKCVRLVKSLGQVRYLSLLKHAHLMIGNSSSGLVEAPSFNLPVVNVGTRQDGRMRGKNVFDVECEKKDILRGIRWTSTYNRTKLCMNPYGDGRSARRIRKFVENVYRFKSREQILKKKFMLQKRNQ